ncbi:cytidylyltransferase domain-containing protein [Brevibacillus centrosporus]|uniref:acylneuraminate cytidylyltransferase family protein n=1 Tax=Brevibacillus centrosporus TaxID=54910 RepID=UPI0039884F05
MIQGSTVLAIIPARGGSKGVPRKNIKLLASKPLIAWTIDEAKKSTYIDRLIVSTDDKEIASISAQYGCEVPFMRPPELAKDDTPGIEPILHAMKLLGAYDYVVLLQPTSPLRTVEDIDGCIEKCMATSAKACVSVTVSDKTPYWMYHLLADNTMKPLIESDGRINRRQDAPDVYVLNGAVYVAQADWLYKSRSFVERDTIGYPMPKERSLDIDTKMDFLVIEELLKSKIVT